MSLVLEEIDNYGRKGRVLMEQVRRVRGSIIGQCHAARSTSLGMKAEGAMAWTHVDDRGAIDRQAVEVDFVRLTLEGGDE